ESDRNSSEPAPPKDKGSGTTKADLGPVTAAYAHSTLAIAPSTHLQSGLALREGVPNYLPEPTSFLLHLLAGASWITHTVPVSHAAAPMGGYQGVL
ncbi:hypothetical protein AB0P39_11820, partial [Streptomyces niveus]